MDTNVDAEFGEFVVHHSATVASQATHAMATLRDLIPDDARTTERSDLVGAVALVLALALGVPFGLTRSGGNRGTDPASNPTGGAVIGRDGVPTQVITDKTLPIELVDGWYVAGNKYVLDWPDKTYARMGTEIAFAVSRKAFANQVLEPLGVQTFSLDGTRARLLPIAGTPGGPDSWSPDGRHVVVPGVAADGMSPEGRLVDVATGTVVRRMAGVVIQAAWVDNDQMLIWELDLTNPDNPDLVVTLQTRDGEVQQRWQPPAEMFESLGFNATGPLAVRLGT